MMDDGRTKDDRGSRNTEEAGQSQDALTTEENLPADEDGLKKIQKPWKQKRQSKNRPPENEIEIFEGRGVVCNPSQLETTKPEGGYIRVICKDDCEFRIPSKVVESFQCVDVILHGDAVFKENLENAIRFPDIEPEIMEYVLRFVFIEHLNKLKAEQYYGPNSPRLVFQFEVDPRYVMDLIYVAHFLGVSDLLNVTATMVARHLQDVPDLSSMPVDLARCVAEQFSPQELYDAEERKDFLSLGLETDVLWEKHCKRFLIEDIVRPSTSSDSCPPYDQWGVCEGPPPTSWKALFISLDLQQLADRQNGSQNGPFFKEVEYKGKWAYSHTVRKMFFEWVLKSPDSLSFTSYTAQYPNLLSLHLHSLPLGTALPDGTSPRLAVGEILASHRLLQILDVSEAEFTAEAAFLLSQSLRSHLRIQVLRLAYNNIGTKGFTAIARTLPHCRTLKVLDVRGNGIGALMEADAVAALQSCLLDELMLDGNFKRRESGNRLARNFSTGSERGVLYFLTGSERGALSQQTPEAPSEDAVPLLLGIPNDLKRLQLRCCNLSDDDADLIVKGLRQHNGIQNVDLSDNQMTTCGAIAMFSWLQGNESLIELSLANNGITDDCSEVLAQTIQTHPTLQKLSMKGNFSHFERRLFEVINAAAARGDALFSEKGLKFHLDLRMTEISTQTRARIQRQITDWSGRLNLII